MKVLEKSQIGWREMLIPNLPKLISKVIDGKASGIMVTPWWLNQKWLPIMTQLLVEYPIILPQKKATLTPPLQ